MCVAFFMHHWHSDYPVAVLLNRDESYQRPTLPAHVWAEGKFAAGQDLKSGGTWCGIRADGRFALLTNFRDFEAYRPGAESRGSIVTTFLGANSSIQSFIAALRHERARYNDFNLILGDSSQAYYYSSRGDKLQTLGEGLHGLSNHAMDNPWPKIERGKTLLSQASSGSVDDLLDVLLDKNRPADDQLPPSGLGMEVDRELASIFIATPTYGTRTSTFMAIDKEGKSILTERTFAPGTQQYTVHTVRP